MSSRLVSGTESPCGNPACRQTVDPCIKGAKYCTKGCRVAHLDLLERAALEKQARAIREQVAAQQVEQDRLEHQKWLRTRQRQEKERRLQAIQEAKDAREAVPTIWSIVSKARYVPRS